VAQDWLWDTWFLDAPKGERSRAEHRGKDNTTWWGRDTLTRAIFLRFEKGRSGVRSEQTPNPGQAA